MNFNQKEVRKLAEGDARTFAALHRTFLPKIHQFALMLLKDNQDTDDICQIVFMKVNPHFSCDLLENNYLCSISNNKSLLVKMLTTVVICLKTTTFAVSATTVAVELSHPRRL